MTRYDRQEGDLIIGERNTSTIATPVERTTGYVLLVALPQGREPEQVAPAPTAKTRPLPVMLRRSSTCDQRPVR